MICLVNKIPELNLLNAELVKIKCLYDSYKEDNNVKFITYASRCIHNRYRDIFKRKYFNEEPLDIEIKDDLYLLDIIP